MIVVMTTVQNADEAERLAEAIVRAKLAACVQVLPPMKSVYWWDDEVQKESEHLLLIKTLLKKYDELEAFIREHHSYDVPEMLAIDSDYVSESYLTWLKSYIS